MPFKRIQNETKNVPLKFACIKNIYILPEIIKGKTGF